MLEGCRWPEGCDPAQYIPRGFRSLGYGTECAAGGGHHQGCWHALACSIPNHHSQTSIR